MKKVILLIFVLILSVIPVFADWDTNLNDRLIVYYPFDNNTDMINGYNLVNGTGIYDSGKIGNALNNSYIYAIGNFSNILTSEGQNYTACVWTYSSITGGVSKGIFGFLDTIGEGVDSGNLCGGHFASGSQWQWFISDTTDMTAYTFWRFNWHYHCLTKNQTTFGYWFDGTLVNQDTSLSPSNNKSTVEILFGSYDDTGINGNGIFEGKIDEFGFWSRELNSSEISQLYNSGNGIAYESLPLATISIDYPMATNYTESPTTLNYTVANASYCWYSLDNSTTNSSVFDCSSDGSYAITSLTANVGENTWIIYANNSNGDETSDSVIFNYLTYIGQTVYVTADYQTTSSGLTGQVISDTISSLASTINWFTIIIVITAMVVLILLVIIIIVAIRGEIKITA